MNKLAIQETFPSGKVGREIVLAQMCHHYRRITIAKPRVDTNLFKPPKVPRLLSAEEANIVQRSLSPRCPPKFRHCLKHQAGTIKPCSVGRQFSPCPKLRRVESRLRACDVYHPAVKPQKTLYQCPESLQQASQTTSTNGSSTAIQRDAAVQTFDSKSYKPLDVRSVKFLRDITNEALLQRAFTSASISRILLRHQLLNLYSLPTGLMERELEELRRQLGLLPECQLTCCTVSDKEAWDALNALVMDPHIKERVIHSLKLLTDPFQAPTTDKTVVENNLKDQEIVVDSPKSSTTTVSSPAASLLLKKELENENPPSTPVQDELQPEADKEESDDSKIEESSEVESTEASKDEEDETENTISQSSASFEMESVHGE